MGNPNTLRLASKEFFQVATATEERMNKEPNTEKKTALRMVAAQCYFYAAVEAIESILGNAGIIVENHQDRIRKIEQNYRLFKNPNDLLTKHKIITQEGLNYLRRVAYRGENGNKFIALKEFGEISQKEMP